MKAILSCFFSMLSLYSMYGQQQLDFSTISPNTLLLHLDEGDKDLTDFAEYYIYDAPNESYYSQIDEIQALSISNYALSSADDGNYTNPQQPTNVYYKAKEQKGLFEYYVYLKFSEDLVQGATYTLDVQNINTVDSSFNITIDQFQNRSEAIHTNQIGYMQDAGVKYAYISQWLGKSNSQISNDQDFSELNGATCHVVRESDNEIIYTGSGSDGLTFKQGITETGFSYFLSNQYWTRTGIWQFDFSEVGTIIETDPDDEYRIVVEGIGASYPFKISNESYDELVKLLASGLYHQRSGIDRNTPYSTLPKPVDHIPGIDGFEITYSNYRRLDNVNADEESFVQLPAQATGFINPTNVQDWMTSPDELPWGSGGHFDAGDHDIYTEHLMVPLFGSLAYLLAPEGFTDGQYNIPENTNGLPDILDEIRWTLDFFRRTKGPTGGICGGKETDNYYAPSWNDGSGNSSSEQMWYVYREDPHASFIYAAASAQYALALQTAGDPNNEASLYIQEAIDAYNWGSNNQEAGDELKETAGFPTQGFFPDAPLMAASMLYSVTGTQEYLDYYISNTSITSDNQALYVFEGYDEQFATWAFTLIPDDRWDNFSPAISLKNTQIQATINWANIWGLNDQDSFPFRNIASSFDPPIGGNTASTPRIFPQILAYHHTQNQNILDNILASNDMNLGGNAENRVYITGAEEVGADRASSDILHNDNYQYGGENIPGIPLYGLWTTNSYYFQSSPPAEEWPHYETHTNSRIYLGHGEFTVHQNSIILLAAYGYLNSLLNENASLSVSDIQPSQTDALIYPNPSSGSFNIRVPPRFSDARITIFDLRGREVDVSYAFAKANTISIQSEYLRPGVYIVKLQSKTDQLSKKLILR